MLRPFTWALMASIFQVLHYKLGLPVVYILAFVTFFYTTARTNGAACEKSAHFHSIDISLVVVVHPLGLTPKANSVVGRGISFPE